jgi:hypothetical protein
MKAISRITLLFSVRTTDSHSGDICTAASLEAVRYDNLGEKKMTFFIYQCIMRMNAPYNGRIMPHKLSHRKFAQNEQL